MDDADVNRSELERQGTGGARRTGRARLRMAGVRAVAAAALLAALPACSNAVGGTNSLPSVGSNGGAVTPLWQNGMESGNLAKWSAPYPGCSLTSGGEYDSGNADAVASTAEARTGSWSAKLVINTTSGKSGARLFRSPCESDQHPEGLYYSAWYYLPRTYQTPAGWWNLFQFKSRSYTLGYNRPMWTLGLIRQSDGTMAFHLSDVHDATNGNVTTYNQSNPVPVPVGRWFQVEAFYKGSNTGNGIITVWQDGVQIFHETGVQTVLPKGGDVRWSVNNYSSDVQPSPTVIYVDDAAITTSFLPPN